VDSVVSCRPSDFRCRECFSQSTPELAYGIPICPEYRGGDRSVKRAPDPNA